MSETVAQAPYPPEVQDVLDSQSHARGVEEQVCAAGAAGFAVVARAGAPRAHLFAVAGGTGAVGAARDALPLPLPAPSTRDPHAPRVTVWPAAQSRRLCVAALDAGGALRLFSDVDPMARSAPRPRELKVSRALALSARAREDEALVSALALAHATDPTASAGSQDALFVFGARGSAALVRVGSVAANANPLMRPEEARRTGISFGALFHSALRSIGGDVRPDAADFEAGTGPHRIVGAAALNGALAACVVREAGTVELWGSDTLLWSVDVFDVVAPRAARADRRVVCAAVSAEDSLVCLVEETRDERASYRIVGFAATHEPPSTVSVEIDLGNITGTSRDSDVVMTLSAGLAYLHVPNTRLLSWVSVARGLDARNQVHGSVNLPEGATVLHVLDATHPKEALSSDDVSGGLVACLCSDAVTLVSSGVPAPMSMEQGEIISTAVQNEEQDVSALLWRAQAQYRAGQIGAVRASLQGLYRATFVNSSPSPLTIGDIVIECCQRIVCSQIDPKTAPMALLIDSELERRQSDYNDLMQLLGDAEVFAGIRENAPSMTDDRIWDMLQPPVRHELVCYGEKLAVARAIRKVENSYVSGSSTLQFRDSATTSLMSEGLGTRTGSAVPSSTLGEDLREIETELSGGSSIVSRALLRAGMMARTEKAPLDDGSLLYRFPLHFNIFLPALRDCLSEVQARSLQPQESDAIGPNSVQRALRGVTLLACQAAIALTCSARDMRSLLVSQLERDQQVLRSFDNWACDNDTRSALDVLVDSVLDLRAGGRQSELNALENAAAQVTDELLACTRSALCDTDRAPSQSNSNLASMAKKRRVNEGDDTSVWGRKRTRALERLRSRKMEKDCLHLAEKYHDFGVMMTLKKEASDFDSYFANAVENYGDQFGLYALRWLEERGEIKLLLKGKQTDNSFQATLATRSDRVNALLSTYFKEDRGEVSNLAWMHWLSNGDLAKAGRALSKQTRSVGVPGRPNSLANTSVLSSVARLTVQASMLELEEAENESLVPGEQLVKEREELEEMKMFVDGMTYMAEVQTQINNESMEPRSELLDTENLVRAVINAAPVESGRLASSAVVALEVVRYANLADEQSNELVDYVWRRCVEKQGDAWTQIVRNVRQLSDDQLRKRLTGTALYGAAVKTAMDETKMKAIVQRDAFRISKFEENQTRAALERIVQTTVALTQMAS